MKIAVYSRKSKYSDKSESIDSQIEYCKQSAYLRYPAEGPDFRFYIDEGFSGGTADRPQYKKMLSDIRSEKDFAAVICYKIDRISRSLSDFTALQQYLEKHSVSIISASEGFDTSTVWGVAVLNILMIFAQLERSNISERIRDAMLHYARQGRWSGGLTPLGFESKSIPYSDALGQEKHMVILSPLEEEIQTVKLIYKSYLELRSLSALESLLSQKNILSRKGNPFYAATLREILMNPVYAAADPETFRYFSENRADICGTKEDFNAARSLLPYNREDKKKGTARPISEWIIAVGKHPPIIKGSVWVKVQHTIGLNAHKKPRLGTARFGLLSGLIRCANCGSTMRVKNGRQSAGGENTFYYVCHLKETSHKEKCDTLNLNGFYADALLIKSLENLARGKNFFGKTARGKHMRLSSPEEDSSFLLDGLKKELAAKQSAINNLVTQLSSLSDTSAGQTVLARLGCLETEAEQLRASINSAKEKIPPREDFSGSPAELFARLCDLSYLSDMRQKRELLKKLVRLALWDGRCLSVHFK